MPVTLTKGGNVSLTKAAPGMTAVLVGLGWDARTTTGDDETIKVNLAAVPAEVDKIVFPVSIYEGQARQQGFGQVRNAFIRIVNQSGNAEIARYDLTEDASTETAMIFGELYRNSGEWKFRAVGQGYSAGLAGIAARAYQLRKSGPGSPRRWSWRHRQRG